MHSRNPIRRLARHTPSPLDGLVEYGAGFLDDLTERRQGPPSAAKLTRLDRLTRIKVLPVSVGPPLGINLLDLPGRVPLPAKITIRVLPPIDLNERFGANADLDAAHDEITGEMQDSLSELSEERTLPVVG